MKKIYLFAALFFAVIIVKSQTLIDAKDVFKHIGETVSICDSVYTSRAMTNLTLLNLGAAFPKQLLTLVIYKADLSKFQEPEKLYLNKKVCVTGKLTLFNDKPQIAITDPTQIVIK